MRVPPEMRCRFCRFILCCGEHRLAHEIQVHAPKHRVTNPLAGIPRFKHPNSSTPEGEMASKPVHSRSPLSRTQDLNDLDSSFSRKRKRENFDGSRQNTSATTAMEPPKVPDKVGAAASGGAEDEERDVFAETPCRRQRETLSSAAVGRSPSTPSDVAMNISDAGYGSEASVDEEKKSNLNTSIDVGSERQDVTPTSCRDPEGGPPPMSAPRPPSIRPRRRPPLIIYSMRRRRLLTPLEEEEDHPEDHTDVNPPLIVTHNDRQ